LLSNNLRKCSQTAWWPTFFAPLCTYCFVGGGLMTLFRLLRSENITVTTQTYTNLMDLDTTVRGDYIRTTINSTWPTTGRRSQQDVSTSFVEEDHILSTTTSSQYYFHPDFLPGGDRSDNVDVVFDVDSMFDEEDVTRRYDDEYHLDVDDDDLRARDLERVSIESVATSHSNRTSPVTSSTTLSVQVTSSFSAHDQQERTVSDFGSTVFATEHHHHQPSSVTSSILPTAATSNSSSGDWWRQFPFFGSVSTTTVMTSSVNTMMATTTSTSTAPAPDVSSLTTMRYTIPPQLYSF